jgi:hypothetical protein
MMKAKPMQCGKKLMKVAALSSASKKQKWRTSLLILSSASPNSPLAPLQVPRGGGGILLGWNDSLL